jgi:hypothetical protein
MIKHYRLNVPLKNFPVGKIIALECDERGAPVDIYWYKRLQEAKFDHCMTVISPVKTKKD